MGMARRRRAWAYSGGGEPLTPVQGSAAHEPLLSREATSHSLTAMLVWSCRLQNVDTKTENTTLEPPEDRNSSSWRRRSRWLRRGNRPLLHTLAVCSSVTAGGEVRFTTVPLSHTSCSAGQFRALVHFRSIEENLAPRQGQQALWTQLVKWLAGFPKWKVEWRGGEESASS